MDTFWTLARVAVSLAVVLGLVWLLGTAARRRGVGGGQAGVAVISRQALSRSASVAVVRVGGQALVLGVTDSSVTLLGSVDPDEVLPPAEDDPEPAGTTAPAGEVPAFEHVMAAVGGPQPLTRAELRARSGGALAAVPTSPGGAAPSRASSHGSSRAASTGGTTSVLAGSALSPATWSRAVGVLRERSARR